MEAKLESLITENEAIKVRTPWLDVSLGGLRTALENYREHQVQARKPVAPDDTAQPRKK
jgi:hypothetical protein